MLKKITFLALLGITTAVSGQDKAQTIEVQSKYHYIDHYFSQDGNIYIATCNDKTSKNNVNISQFDADFNLLFSKDFESQYRGLGSFFGRGIQSPQIFYNASNTLTGKYLICHKDKSLLTSNGDLKRFVYSHGKELEDFDTKFYIFTDEAACYFGYKKIKNKPSEIPSLYKVNLDKVTNSIIPLDFPAFPNLIQGVKEPKRKKVEKKEWDISSFDNKQITFINKVLSENRMENQYNIVHMDFDGKVIASLSLPLTLKNRFFTLSDTGLGSVTITLNGMSGSALMEDSATGNVFIEGNNEFYYVYGLYSNERIGDPNKADYNGFYIYKYNAKGELLWKNEKAISNATGFNETQRPIAVKVSFKRTAGDKIGFCISSFHEKYAQLYLMDSNDGKILKNKATKVKIEGDRLEGIRGSAFPTGYAYEGGFAKKHFDKNSLFAAFLSEEVEAYFKKTSADDLNYNCMITAKSVYLIEENYRTKALKFLRFDL